MFEMTEKVKGDLIWIMMCMTFVFNFIIISTELVATYVEQRDWKHKINTSITTQLKKSNNQSQQISRRPSLFVQSRRESFHKVIRIT